MYGKGCHFDHLGMEFAGVDDAETWACPYCHLVFKKPTEEKVKPNGSHSDPAH